MRFVDTAARAALPTLVLWALAGAAWAQEAQDTVSTLVVTAPRVESAPYEAPSLQPIQAIQPTSLVTAHFIANNLSPTVNYDEAVRITPSVQAVAPNGPGLMENQFLDIRGFQDGQYNLTVDGLAWGDSNDFTHHSTSYLMAHDIGVVAVDRGPGTASTLGDATFGGTVELITKDPLDHTGGELYGSLGSFNTYLGGGEIDTGPIPELHGARGLVDIEHEQSSGRLSFMGMNRTNVFTKWEADLTPHATLTVMAMYNTLHQDVGLGATTAQIQAFGYDYALNDNPSGQSYFGYNYDKIATDMVYIGVNWDVGDGINIDNKVYEYGYWHRGFNGEDPNGEWPNGLFVNGVFYPNDVPGQALTNDYYSLGDIIRVIKTFPGFGDVKAGFWYDHQFNHRRLFEQDFSQGHATDVQPVYDFTTTPPSVVQPPTPSAGGLQPDRSLPDEPAGHLPALFRGRVEAGPGAGSHPRRQVGLLQAHHSRPGEPGNPGAALLPEELQRGAALGRDPLSGERHLVGVRPVRARLPRPQPERLLHHLPAGQYTQPTDDMELSGGRQFSDRTFVSQRRCLLHRFRQPDLEA